MEQKIVLINIISAFCLDSKENMRYFRNFLRENRALAAEELSEKALFSVAKILSGRKFNRYFSE